MTTAAVAEPPQAESRPRRVGWWAFTLFLLIVFAIVSALVVPRMQANGSPVLTTYDLDASQTTPGLRLRGATEQGVFGIVVRPHSSGAAAFTVSAAPPRNGQRTTLTLSAGGAGVPARVTLTDGSGVRHLLGTPTSWQRHRIDITSLRGSGRARLEFSATNPTSTPKLIGDQVIVATYPSEAIPRASRWEVAAWVALGVLLILVPLRRVRQDAGLVALTGYVAFIVWPSVVSGALDPLPSDLWTPSVGAKWLDLDRGLVSGTFDGVSSLGVQLFHALSPVTGSGVAGARVESMLVGIAAVIAIYTLGKRIGGLPAAVVAVACALLADAFRLSLSTGNSTGTLVLAATVFLLAVHHTLRHRDRQAFALLGIGGALAILADPTWWPGVVAAILLLALREAPRGTRRTALVTAVLALAIVSLPSRVSVAHQSSGDVTADVTLRTTLTRNVEFVGRGHSAPPTRQELQNAPYSGQKVGLASYVFGDHALSVVIGGTLSGAYDGISAAADRSETGLAGLIALIVEIVGVAFLLLLPRLRLLVLIPALLAVVPWFLADRGGVLPFSAEAAFWPAMLAGAAALTYAVWQSVGQRLGTHRAATELRRRAASLGRRGNRRAEPAKP